MTIFFKWLNKLHNIIYIQAKENQHFRKIESLNCQRPSNRKFISFWRVHKLWWFRLWFFGLRRSASKTNQDKGEFHLKWWNISKVKCRSRSENSTIHSVNSNQYIIQFIWYRLHDQVPSDSLSPDTYSIWILEGGIKLPSEITIYSSNES